MSYESCIPVDELKDFRWSLSVNEAGHEMVQEMKDEVGINKRAVFSRCAMYLGMYYMSIEQGRMDRARKIEKFLNDHDIFPRENLRVIEASKLIKTA